MVFREDVCKWILLVLMMKSCYIEKREIEKEREREKKKKEFLFAFPL